MTDSNKKTTWKRTFIEWAIMAAIAAVIYAMGWHTEVIGTLQRAMLWTGLFDADTSQIATTNGPTLSDSDYNLSLQTPDGKPLTMDEFQGEVLFINLWASWCPPCVAEMPTIQTLYENVGDYENIRFILLSMDQNPEKAVSFMERKEFSMPYYFPQSPLPVKLQSSYLPTTFVISKEKQIIYKKEGIADYSSPTFAQWMRELAEKQKADP